MNRRQSLHPCVLEFAMGETLSSSNPKINTFELEDQSLEDIMVENPNQN